MYRWAVLTLAAIPLVLTALRLPPAPPTWWTTDGMEKIRPYDRPPGKLRDSVEISAAHNEFEAFQIVFRSDSGDVDGMDLEVSDFKGPDNAVLSKQNITIYFERYLNLAQPSSIEGAAGEWPDALVPRTDRYFGERRNAFPFTLLNRHDQPIWIEVYVPTDTPAGVYHGSVAVSLKEKLDATVPVTLTVWNFSLPSTSSFPTSFGLNGVTAFKQHFGKYTSDEDVIRFTKLYRKAALWHRLSVHAGSLLPPVVQFSGDQIHVDWTKVDSEIGPFLDGTAIGSGEPLYGAKATSTDLVKPSGVTGDSQNVSYWRAYADHFRQKGWSDRLLNYIADEPQPATFPELLRQAQLVHSADASIKNMVTASFRTSWASSIDMFVPLINCLAFKPGKQNDCDQHVEQPMMQNLWWYQSCASHGCNSVGGEYYRGWPSYMIDIAPVANRIMPWLAWKYDIKGELYFHMNEAFSRKPDPWNDVSLHGGNGDGTLFYPGKPSLIGGKTDIPIESIRLKLIREGLEDYEYLLLLSKYEGREAASRFVDRMVTNAYTYERDPAKLYELRREIAQELSK